MWFPNWGKYGSRPLLSGLEFARVDACVTLRGKPLCQLKTPPICHPGSRSLFNPLGPVLAVRPYCDNAHYWQVYFDTNRVIRETFGEAGFPAPEQNVFIRSGA